MIHAATLATAMAVAGNALYCVTGAQALIKWPNDIVINGREDLVDSYGRVQLPRYQHIAVIGKPPFGINVHNESFPEELQDHTSSWYEVDFSKIGFEMKNREIAKKSEKKWFPYNNGGNYRKWYGNNEAIVDWKNDGEDIKNFKLKKQKKNSGFNVGIAALNDIFKKGLTYSIFGFRNFGIRYKGLWIFI